MRRWRLPAVALAVTILAGVFAVPIPPTQALDGKPYRVVRSVDASTITFTAEVEPNGDISSGTMLVNISWSKRGTGGRATFNTSGTLTLGGGVDALVAAGTLTTSQKVWDSEGNYLEDLSHSRADEATWIFRASRSVCAFMTGTLDPGTRGRSILAGALTSGPEFTNNMAVVYQAWPEGYNGAAEFIDSLAQLNEVMQSILALGAPSPLELVLYIQLIEKLRNDALELEQCGQGIGLTTDTGEDALAALMQDFLAKALEQADQFTAQELIELLTIGVRSGALSPAAGAEGAEAVREGFIDALDAALDQAISASNTATIIDIAMAAGQFGFTDLYDKAVAAYEETK